MAHDEEMAHLLSIVSHDLRSPLTALLLGSRFAQREVGLSEQGRQVLSELEDAAEDLQRRLYDALDLLRAAHGLLHPAAQTVELFDLAQGVARDGQRRARQRRLALAVTGGTAYVRGEGQVLPRALFALLDHALRNAAEGGRVTVDVSQREGGGLVRVTDDGPLLAAPERMFELSGGTEGTRQLGGVGLAFAAGAAGALGGRTWAEPREPHGGATLCLWLPPAS